MSAYAAANCAVVYEILGDLAAAYEANERALTYFDAMHSADARQQAVNIRYYQARLRDRSAK